MSSTAAAPYGKDGSPAPSSSNLRHQTPTAKASAIRADQTQNNLPRWPSNQQSQPDIIHSRDTHSHHSSSRLMSQDADGKVAAVSPGPGNAARCEACGKEVQMPAGCQGEGQCSGENCPIHRGQAVIPAGLTTEEAEVLAELNRNKSVAPYVSSVRRTVMGMAIVWWTLFGYSFSKCKNTGECNEMLNMVRFVRGAPSLISFPVLGGVLFGTAIWMTYFLDMTVHLIIGVVRVSRWVFGHDENEAQETAEITSYITTQLQPEQGSEEAHTIQRETTPVYRLGATLSHPSSSGVSTSTTGIPPSGEQQHAADSGGNRGDQAEGDDSSSNQESPSQQEKGSGSWIALPNLLTKVFGADAQEAEPVSQGGMMADPYPADAQIPFKKAPDVSTSTGTDTKVSVTTTPESTNQRQLAAYVPSSSVSKSTDTSTTVKQDGGSSSVTPQQAQAEATAAEAAALAAGAQDSRSSMEMLAEIPATFMALVRKSGEAIHDALFWESTSPNNRERTDEQNQQEEQGSGGTTTTDGTSTSTKVDAGRSRTTDPTPDTVSRAAAEAERRMIHQVEAIRQQHRSNRTSVDDVQQHEILPNDSYGIKHSEASDFEKKLSSATSSRSERSRRIVAVRRQVEDGHGHQQGARKTGVRSHDDVQQCRRGSCREGQFFQTSNTLISAQKQLASHTSGGFLADKIESAGASTSHGSRSKSRFEEMKLESRNCVQQACSRNMGTAATTASADYALMGSTAKTNDRTHTETSDQNTSALKISPCKCDSKAPESGLRGGGGSLPSGPNHQQQTSSTSARTGEAGASSVKASLLKAVDSKKPGNLTGGAGSGKGQSASCDGTCPGTMFSSVAPVRGTSPSAPEFTRRMAPQQQQFNSQGHQGTSRPPASQPPNNNKPQNHNQQASNPATESFSASGNERRRPPAGEAMLITEQQHPELMEGQMKMPAEVDVVVAAKEVTKTGRPSASSIEKLLSQITSAEPGISSNAAHHRRRRRLEPRHGPFPCSVFSDDSNKRRSSKVQKADHVKENAARTEARGNKDDEKLKKFTGRSSSGGCDSTTVANYERTVAELQEMLRLECVRAIEAPFAVSSNDVDSGRCLSDSDPSTSCNSCPVGRQMIKTTTSRAFFDGLCTGRGRPVTGSDSSSVSRSSPVSCASDYGTQKSTYH